MDCLNLVYNVNNINNFENIETLCKTGKIDIKTIPLIYLIGINFDTKEKIRIPEAADFSYLNKIKHYIISIKNNNDIINLLNNLFNMKKIRYQSKDIYRIVILGVEGKTCLCKRLIYNEYNKYDLSISTTGIDNYSKKINSDGKEINLTLYDTPGAERFKNICFLSIKKSDCAILLFDITSRSSFESMDFWVKKIVKNYKNIKLIYLIGNKIDLKEKDKLQK